MEKKILYTPLENKKWIEWKICLSKKASNIIKTCLFSAMLTISSNTNAISILAGGYVDRVNKIGWVGSVSKIHDGKISNYLWKASQINISITEDFIEWKNEETNKNKILKNIQIINKNWIITYYIIYTNN